jgi:hypothetical protein
MTESFKGKWKRSTSSRTLRKGLPIVGPAPRGMFLLESNPDASGDVPGFQEEFAFWLFCREVLTAGPGGLFRH